MQLGGDNHLEEMTHRYVLVLYLLAGRDDSQLCSCTLPSYKRIWLQMNFWEICVFHWVMDIWNCTFPISTIEIENYNGCKSLNMALASHNLTWFGCLRPSSATWWRQPSDRDDPQLHSCTLLGCKRIFEKYVFSTE